MTHLSPSEPPNTRRASRALLLAKHEVAPCHFVFTLHELNIARVARPGQFVHVLPHPCNSASDSGWNFDPLLRRAFSIMDTRPDKDEFDLLFRVEGRGTKLLSQAKEGEYLDLIGPLGNGFSLHRASQHALLVGGGVGVPPMVFAARELQSQKVEPIMLLGARSSKDVLCEAYFEALRVPLQIATDDGSRGHAGRVGDLLELALEKNTDATVFACGPYPMLRAVATVCEAKGVYCEVSLEENMPCGIGVCNGCAVPTRSQSQSLYGDDYGRYRRICVHGPACDARDIDWT